MTTNLPDLNYSERDPDLILAKLKSELTEFTDGQWTDFTENDLGYAFIKAAVALYGMNSFFCDRQVAETFITLATMRESVIRRAKELGYTPRKASPATVSVRLSFPSFVTGFQIPAGSSWVINNINFQCLDAITIPADATSTEVVLTQGVPYSSTTVGTGQAWTKLLLPVTASLIKVKVNNTLWTEVSTFIEVPQENSYRVYEDVGGQTILFGVKLNGLSIPLDGDSVSVSAILTSGKAGNIYVKNQNVRPQTVILNAAGAVVTSSFSGTTLTSALGGDDVESTASIRKNAPNFYGTQDRGVSEKDIDAIVKTIPGVRDAFSIGGEKLNSYGRVFITVYGASPYELTSDLQLEVQRVLGIKGVGGLTFIVNSPQVVEVQQIIRAGVSNAKYGNLSIATNLITTAANEFFAEQKVSQNLYDSEESCVIQDIEGVIFNNIETHLNTFASSSAGKIRIPIVPSGDMSAVTLKKADGTVLFSGNGTQYVTNGVFVYTATGIPDQRCDLFFDNLGPDILLASGQITVLTSLSVRPVLVS